MYTLTINECKELLKNSLIHTIHNGYFDNDGCLIGNIIFCVEHKKYITEPIKFYPVFNDGKIYQELMTFNLHFLKQVRYNEYN